jgi:glycosyltransferase involved in cell wall biosynthesis
MSTNVYNQTDFVTAPSKAQLRESHKLTPINLSQLTVVIPAYNEAEKIRDVIAELQAEIPGIEILVIDDGSNDNTGTVARNAGAQVVIHGRNKGYGAALKTGIRTATTPYVAMYDADGQHRPSDLLKLIDCAGNCHIVIGARGKESDRTLSRRPGKWVLARVANLLAGRSIPDLNSGLRVIHRETILRYLHLLPSGFSASTTTTICFMQRDYEVAFVPIVTRKRVGKSTVKQFRDGMNTIALMINLIILFNPQRFFLPPAILLVAIGSIYGLARAIIEGQGIPMLAVLVVMTGLIAGMFGLLAKQISTLRIELYEREAIAEKL